MIKKLGLSPISLREDPLHLYCARYCTVWRNAYYTDQTLQHKELQRSNRWVVRRQVPTNGYLPPTLSDWSTAVQEQKTSQSIRTPDCTPSQGCSRQYWSRHISGRSSQDPNTSRGSCNGQRGRGPRLRELWGLSLIPDRERERENLNHVRTSQLIPNSLGEGERERERLYWPYISRTL